MLFSALLCIDIIQWNIYSRERRKRKVLWTTVDETVLLFQSVILISYNLFYNFVLSSAYIISKAFQIYRMRSPRKSKLLPRVHTPKDVKSKKLIFKLYMIFIFIQLFFHFEISSYPMLHMNLIFYTFSFFAFKY